MLSVSGFPVPSSVLVLKWELSEWLLNECMGFYLGLNFSLPVWRTLLRLLSFTLGSMGMFSTRDLCDPSGGLETEMRPLGPPGILIPEISGHQP